MNLETIKEYLKDKINNRWYLFAKEDYGIEGKFIDCTIENDNFLKITWEEMGEKRDMTIAYFQDYNLYQLYCIWMEG